VVGLARAGAWVVAAAVAGAEVVVLAGAWAEAAVAVLALDEPDTASQVVLGEVIG